MKLVYWINENNNVYLAEYRQIHYDAYPAPTQIEQKPRNDIYYKWGSSRALSKRNFSSREEATVYIRRHYNNLPNWEKKKNDYYIHVGRPNVAFEWEKVEKL